MELEEKAYAGFWIRVSAAVIDIMVYIIPAILIMLCVYSWKNLTLMLILNLALMTYKPFMEFKYGATFGKMALNLKVVSIDYQPMTFPQSLIRSLPWLLSATISIYAEIALMTHPLYNETVGFLQIAQLQQEVTPNTIQTIVTLFFLITVLTVAFDKQKRGLHDMLAKTYCLKYY